MTFAKLIYFLSKFTDSIIFNKIKTKLINFVFQDRHTPLKKTKKVYINQNYYIDNFYYDVQDYSHVSQIIYSSYEKDIFIYYLNNFKANENFIDIGSNIGIHSFFVLKYLNPKKVISIEPQKLCIDLQKKTLQNNTNLKSENINFINSALGPKKSKIQVFRGNSGSGSILNDFGNDPINPSNLYTFSITNKSIKDIFKLISNNVVNIKIDVQGSEMYILEELFKSDHIKYVKKIIFEINLYGIDKMKTLLKKYSDEFKLTNLDGSELSIEYLHHYVKNCLVLSNKLFNDV